MHLAALVRLTLRVIGVHMCEEVHSAAHIAAPGVDADPGAEELGREGRVEKTMIRSKLELSHRIASHRIASTHFSPLYAPSPLICVGVRVVCF